MTSKAWGSLGIVPTPTYVDYTTVRNPTGKISLEDIPVLLTDPDDKVVLSPLFVYLLRELLLTGNSLRTKFP